jgi:hypothetical protein
MYTAQGEKRKEKPTNGSDPAEDRSDVGPYACSTWPSHQTPKVAALS